MLIIFFDCEGVVHYELALRGQTINKEHYVGALKRLRDAVERKWPRVWSSGDWLLHHDNAPAHSSNLVQQLLVKHKIVQLRQLPYSPDTAPCEFWMFPNWKWRSKESGSTTSRRFRLMRRASWRPCQKLRSRTALRCGSTAGSVWFNQMENTSKDATVRMTKSSTNAEIRTQVGYFSDTPRIFSLLHTIYSICHEEIKKNRSRVRYIVKSFATFSMTKWGPHHFPETSFHRIVICRNKKLLKIIWPNHHMAE